MTDDQIFDLEPIGYVVHQIAPQRLENYIFSNNYNDARMMAENVQLQYRRIVLTDPIPVYEINDDWALVKRSHRMSVRDKIRAMWFVWRGHQVV